MTDTRREQKNTNRGFTLVELIVVLVILAVLAAILVPVLLGWIDKARRKQDLIEAKNCLTAAQVEFSSYYAMKKDKEEGQVSVLSPSEVKHYEGRKENNIISNADMYLYKCYSGKTFSNSDLGTSGVTLTDYSDFAKSILKSAGYDKEEDYPYYLIVGTGHYVKYIDTDPHKPYTVYFCFFQKDENSKPIFFDGNNWVEKYPKDSIPEKNKNDRNFNYYTINGEKMRIQYYLLCNKETNKKDNWYEKLSANSKK